MNLKSISWSLIIIVKIALICLSFSIVHLEAKTLEMKTLILSASNPVSDLVTTMLRAYGVNYDLVTVTSNENSAINNIQLYDGNGDGNYNSIILSDLTLSVLDLETQQWVAKLTPLFKEALDEYINEFNIRSVILFSNPNADGAITPVGENFGGTTQNADAFFLSQAESGINIDQLVSNIRPDSKFAIGNENEFDKSTYYWYKVALDETQNANNRIKPFMKICPREDIQNCYVGAFIKTTDVGEEMHFMFSSNIYTLHGIVLFDVLLPWVTRGIFTGERRIVLSTQVDDYFLETGVYNTQMNRQFIYGVDNDESAIYRISGSDINYLNQYQNQIRNVLPAGSNFTFEMAYNGKGFIDFDSINNPESLEYLTLALRDNFLWVTHTWNHIDMRCIESDCTPSAVQVPPPNCYEFEYDSVCVYNTFDNEPVYPTSGFTSYELVHYEISKNKWFAKNKLYADKTLIDMLDESSTFSHFSMVTPRISGLNYSVSLQAMLDNGIFVAVGDTSRKDLQPENPYHTFKARPLVSENGSPFNDPGQFAGGNNVEIIPRFATRIYFDSSTPEENAMEHNAFYGPNCDGFDQIGTIGANGLRCNTTSYKYDRDLTFMEILQLEKSVTAKNLLQYRHDPYMFHQANLKAFQSGGGQTCLLCMWITEVVDAVMSYNTFPILTYKMDDLYNLYKEKESYDKCNIGAKLVSENFYDDNFSVLVSSAGQCKPKITFTNTIDGYLYDTIAGSISPSDTVYDYGVDKTVTFNIQ